MFTRRLVIFLSLVIGSTATALSFAERAMATAYAMEERSVAEHEVLQPGLRSSKQIACTRAEPDFSRRPPGYSARVRIPPGSDRDVGRKSKRSPASVAADRDELASDWNVPARSESSEESTRVWKSEELNTLAIGMDVGDVDGDKAQEIVVIDPTTVYVYRMIKGRLSLIASSDQGPLELKSVDVAPMVKGRPARIYVTAQNRGIIASFVQELRNGALDTVIEGFPYYLRVIPYPTRGPYLLGQQKALHSYYDGPIYQLKDLGDKLEPVGRFGVPLKIPIFGFCIGDFEGKREPLIAVYDRSDHLRVYEPSGKRLYRSLEYYGGSDVVLRLSGPEERQDTYFDGMDFEQDHKEFYRPRILSLDLDANRKYEVLAIKHFSKTRRLFSNTKMLEDGRVVCLSWNGDALVEQWSTPKIQGMITDFSVTSLPGLPGRLILTLERKKTDWFSFLSSRSQIRGYRLDKLEEGAGARNLAPSD